MDNGSIYINSIINYLTQQNTPAPQPWYISYLPIIQIAVTVFMGFVAIIFTRRLEHYKSELSKQQIYSSQIYQRRANAVAELYSRIQTAKHALLSLAFSIPDLREFYESIFTGENPDARLSERFEECYNDFQQFFECNKIFIPKETRQKIESLLQLLHIASEEAIAMRSNTGQERRVNENNIRDLRNQFNGVLEDIEKDFLLILEGKYDKKKFSFFRLFKQKKTKQS